MQAQIIRLGRKAQRRNGTLKVLFICLIFFFVLFAKGGLGFEMSSKRHLLHSCTDGMSDVCVDFFERITWLVKRGMRAQAG